MFRFVSALSGAVLLLAVAAGAARADQPYTFASTYGLLPKTVIPTSYDITLQPDLDKRVTSGHETVRITVAAPTKTIVFDTLEMTVTRASLGPAFAAPLVSANAKAQTTTLTFATTIRPGRYALALTFAGKIGTQPQGLFVQPYTTSTGAKEEMLATQFESTDARRMFPCWDEPAFRASYRLTVTVPSAFEAISNMPVASQTTAGATKTVRFAPTPSMSTYLLVFSAGRFASIADSVDGVRVRVVAPYDRIAEGRYALGAATKLLAYFDTYYGYKYPLPKLDLIDVPGGFPGAMENWGGITFTESTLLFDPRVQSETAKIDIFETIAHEMSHQWTGDLVTMDWWSGTWLNESFADWMETKASAHFNPQWHLWDTVESATTGAMESDEESTTHPVEQPVADDKAAGTTFDEITYQKGGAVVRMMEQYLGEDAFRAGVRAYIKAHAYSNATAADLWSGLSGATHRDVAKIAEAFVTTPGLPVVDVTATCVNGERTIGLQQRRFFIEPGATSTQSWTIPVGIDVGGKTTYTLLDTPSATAPGGRCDQPFLVNSGALGYYRTNFDDAEAAAVIARFGALSVAERARFIDDRNATMLAGIASPQRLVDAVGAVQPADALTVWSAVQSALGGISELEVGQPGSAAFDAYRIRVLSPVLARIGWDAQPGEDALTSDLRSNLIQALGYCGDAAVIAEARARFAKFLVDPSSLPTALRSPVFSTVGIFADAPTWERLHTLFKAAKTPAEGRQLAVALWGARDPALATKNLDMVTNNELPTEYGGELGFYDVAIVATRGGHAQLAWSFFKAHSSELLGKISEFERPFVIAAVAPLFWNAAPASELDAYIDAAAGVPPPLVAKAKHEIDVKLAQRSKLLPAIDAATAAKAALR